MRAHGTRACYVFGPEPGSDRSKGCRCEPCTIANRTYARERDRAVRRPDIVARAAYVDARRAAEHLDMLCAAGVGLRTVAERTGLSRSVLARIRKRQILRSRRDTIAKILAVGRGDAKPGSRPAHPASDAQPVDSGSPAVVEPDDMAVPAGSVGVEVLISRVAGDMAWRARAACRDADPALFFPERGESLAPAHAYCAGCAVRDTCLDEGLGERFGVWGGTSERERRRLRRTVRTAAAAGTRELDDGKRDEVA